MKKILAFFSVLLLFAALPARSFAAGTQLGFVTDAVPLLTAEEQMALEDAALDVSEQYGCGVYIITLDDFQNYVETDSVYEAAKAIYREYALGLGEGQNGLLLLLSMAERDYALIAYGYGNTAFTDYGKEKLEEEFLDNFSHDDWVGGFEDYIKQSARMLSLAAEGTPLDAGQDPALKGAGALFSLVLGCLLSFLICQVLKSRMKSVAVGTEAGNYVREGSLNFTVREDIYTHTTESRVKIEKSSGSGGGTSVDRDGFSGSSGKF